MLPFSGLSCRMSRSSSPCRPWTLVMPFFLPVYVFRSNWSPRISLPAVCGGRWYANCVGNVVLVTVSRYSAPLVPGYGYLVSVRTRDTKVLLEKPGHWREDCSVTKSGHEHRRW
jgi:hypothetical protein